MKLNPINMDSICIRGKHHSFCPENDHLNWIGWNNRWKIWNSKHFLGWMSNINSLPRHSLSWNSLQVLLSVPRRWFFRVNRSVRCFCVAVEIFVAFKDWCWWIQSVNLSAYAIQSGFALPCHPICSEFSSSFPEAFSSQSHEDQTSMSTIRPKPQRIGSSHFFLKMTGPQDHT